LTLPAATSCWPKASTRTVAQTLVPIGEKCRKTDAQRDPGGVNWCRVVYIPVKIVRHRFTKVIVQPAQTAPNNWQAQMDAKLMKALCMALYWQEQLDSGAVGSIAEIAKREGMEKMRTHKFMKLARRAPQFMEAIARGQGPIGLSFEFFVRKVLPHDWGQQEDVMEALAR
jgi:hypothetical protein